MSTTEFSRPTIERETYGIAPGGQRIELFTLTNDGMRVRFISFGGIIVTIAVPDRRGRIGDVTLGYDSLAEYLKDTRYFGALIGRYANRIANGHFALDGRRYELARNHGQHHLHGGIKGFHTAVWEVAPFRNEGDVGALLMYTSPDGEDGYPGTLVVRVTYTLTFRHELIFDYHATTDAATPVNFTQHAYFNLNGLGRHDVLDHELTLNASHFTPIDEGLIPTGEISSVAGTPLDFTRPTRIGERIDAHHEQLLRACGYDHNFVLDRRPGGDLSFAARLRHPATGRTIEVHTTEPGVQFYTGNFIEGRYGRRSGLTLETQHFPDSPNQPQFLNTILRPGEEFRSRTVYRFTVTESSDRR